MNLTKEQQAVLDGAKGEVMAKVMKTLVMYGEAFGAERMVPVTSKYNHLVTSFGLKMMKPVFELMQQLTRQMTKGRMPSLPGMGGMGFMGHGRGKKKRRK